MPTYEFRCRSCQHQFEVFQSMSAPDPEACEQCGAAELEKVLFPVAVHYKGSGFYNTDYGTSKSKGGDASTTSTGSSDSPSGDSSGSSSDSTSTSSGSSSDAGSSTSSSSSTD